MKIIELVNNMSDGLPVKIINTWTFDTIFFGKIGDLKAIKEHTRRQWVDYEWDEHKKQLVIYVSVKEDN